MIVAIITPYAGEPPRTLQQCIESVQRQTCTGDIELRMIIVGDGHDPPLGDIDIRLRNDNTGPLYLDVLTLPKPARDAGATPRAVGSSYAIGCFGIDAIAFLDADNAWLPGHLDRCIRLTGSGVCVASTLRYLCHGESLEPMLVDTVDSDGLRFADTNCMMLFGAAAKIATTWNWPAPGRQSAAPTGADRNFWQRVKNSVKPAELACTQTPTVLYRTSWLNHYPVNSRFKPPKICKIIRCSRDGTPIALRVRPLSAKNGERRIEVHARDNPELAPEQLQSLLI